MFIQWSDFLARDCQDIYESGVRTSGDYTIQPLGKEAMTVYQAHHNFILILLDGDSEWTRWLRPRTSVIFFALRYIWTFWPPQNFRRFAAFFFQYQYPFTVKNLSKKRRRRIFFDIDILIIRISYNNGPKIQKIHIHPEKYICFFWSGPEIWQIYNNMNISEEKNTDRNMSLMPPSNA